MVSVARLRQSAGTSISLFLGGDLRFFAAASAVLACFMTLQTPVLNRRETYPRAAALTSVFLPC